MIERLRTLPPGRQLLAALVGVLVLSVLLLGAWSLARTSYRPLFTGLKATDAATVVAELDRRKADYRLADGGSTILVPASKVDATRLELMNQNLTLKGVVGFELFNKSDLGLTDFTQRINYQRALQGELERTIMSLDGVDGARVHLSLGEDRLFREDRVAPKASVTLHMHPGILLQPGAASGIQRLVAAAVPQLQASEVVILDEHGDIISGEAVAAGSGTADEHQAVGEFYAARIRTTVKPLLGDDVRVAVEAGLPADSAAQPDPAVFDPANRGFPLGVTLTLSRPLDPMLRQQVQAAVAQAIAFAPAKGDTIGFELARVAAPPRRSYPIADAPQGATDPETTDLIAALPALYGWYAAGVLLLFAIGGVLLRSRAAPRRLSEAQRARLAARLAYLIEREGEDHASSR